MNAYTKTLSIITIALGSFLLFQIQPLSVKTLLPLFGGGSSVWIVGILFFQNIVLIGYIYAHFTKKVGAKENILHTILVIFSIISLFLIKPWETIHIDIVNPAKDTLVTLFKMIGLPSILLASTSPLVQRWLSNQTTPYRYYSLSNIFSLLALISFPILEMYEPIDLIWKIWVFGFLIYSITLLLLNHIIKKQEKNAPVTENDVLYVKPTIQSTLKWIGLSMLSVTILMGITTVTTEDIASAPIVWIIPLVAYLLSFILTFESTRWHKIRSYAVIIMISGFIFINGVLITDSSVPLYLQIIVSTILSFFGFMLLHSILASSKPEKSNLTIFYLAIAFGGSLGGLFSGIIAPIIFKDYFEIYISLFILMVFAMHIFKKTGNDSKEVRYVVVIIFTIMIASNLINAANTKIQTVTIMERNFYGIFKINEDSFIIKLVHGNTIHGIQIKEEQSNTPTSYYGLGSGVGKLFKIYEQKKPLKVALVGLGTGTLASYGDSNDIYTFYEINPIIIKIAKENFSFLRNSHAQIQIIEGDARLNLAKEQNTFDIIVLDAFSSDAIPVHLLTDEAIKIYLSKLKVDGVIAVHISNRNLDLSGIVKTLADKNSLHALKILSSKNNLASYEFASDWVLVSREKKILQKIDTLGTNSSTEFKGGPLWTDNKNSIIEVIKL